MFVITRRKPEEPFDLGKSLLRSHFQLRLEQMIPYAKIVDIYDSSLMHWHVGMYTEKEHLALIGELARIFADKIDEF